ncbi:MAG: GLPGLI family protein [Bacteroidia bacterium]
MIYYKSILFIIFMLFLSLANSPLDAQVNYGKITYERKTNLYKKYKDRSVREWIKEEEKNKIDIFELYFNDTASVYQPQESNLKEKQSWATTKNTVYVNFNTQQQLSIKSIWGEKVYVEDSLTVRKWKLTDSRRIISGYDCKKVIYEKNDSTRIYAWYTDDIIPSVGPESFYGLPGAVLGLATEDGGVIYFAKAVEVSKPDMIVLIPKKKKNKIYTNKELKLKLEKDFAKQPWAKLMIAELFNW